MNTSAQKIINGFPKKFVSNKWLEEFERTGKGWLRILSDSMSPFIQTGDRIFIEKVSPSNVHVGDIMTFWKGNILVTHRIIRKFRKEGDTYLIERGDQYPHHSLVSPESLVGKVRQIQKNDKVYNSNEMPLLMINRFAGIALNYAFATRLIARKVPFLPRPMKNIIKRVYKLLALISNKILRSTLVFKK